MHKSGTKFLLEPEAVQLLNRYQIGYPQYTIARSEEEAVLAAKTAGFPVVLKVVSPQVIHKSDMGGVKVNINSAKEVSLGYREIIKNVKGHLPDAQILGMMVVKQAPKGEEIIIGVTEDEIFGKTLMYGMGGILTEVFNDVTFRVCPIDQKAAAEMIQEIKGHKVLCGIRGSEAVDTEALTELLAKVSNLVMENDEIREIDLNPVRLYHKGLLVLDARIMMKTDQVV